MGELAQSFNGMSLQLRAANEEIVTWAKTLEERVEEKTSELQRAHDHMLHVEKMASIGKMAAVVAHEVNNPLSGILTYAKLLRKWVASGQAEHEKREEAMQCLELIAAESRRCGDLVKNLLTLSRTAPMNVQSTDLRTVIDRCLLASAASTRTGWNPAAVNTQESAACCLAILRRSNKSCWR